MAVDGTGHCQNSAINCNIYSGKQYVWLNGGPATNRFRRPGLYFFTVLNPGGQPNPNDPTVATPNADNLSCPTVGCADPYTNRMFTVGASGEISAYGGTHNQDANGGKGMLIRLCNGGPSCPPYIDTPNPGGEYDMAVCYLGADLAHISYPVDTNKVCKHDNFKVRSLETGPPICRLSLKGTNGSGYSFIQVSVGDTGSGLKSVVVTKSTNANVVIPAFTVGDQTLFTVTATRIVKTTAATLTLTVTDVDGNSVVCDPALATLRAARANANPIQVFHGIAGNEGFVRIANGHSGFAHMIVTVNGHRFELGALATGKTRLVDVRSALRPGLRNTITVRGIGGKRGATATVLISD